MTMTQRKKLSKSGWVLLALLIIAPVVLITLHFTGVIDLSFIGSGYLQVMMWGADNGWNALIVGIGHVVFGVAILYFLKSYIIGEKITTVVGGGYNPQPTYPTAPPVQQQETEIS